MTRLRRLPAAVVAAVLVVAGGVTAGAGTVGTAVAAPSAPSPGPTPGAGQPRDSATARAQAQALRQRIQTLQARIDTAVARWSEAEDALSGAARAEAAAAQRYDRAARAAEEARANTGRTARALYMIGGPGSLVVSVLSGGSIDAVLDGVTALRGMVNGTGLAIGAQARAEAALAAADRARTSRRLTSDERVRLAAEAKASADEAQALQLELDRQLAAADETVQRLLAEERQRDAAAQAAEAAREAAAAQAAAQRAAAAAGRSAPSYGPTYLGALDPMQLVAVLHQAGFEGEGLRIAWAVAMRESGGRPTAIGSVNPNGTRDHGLFQINDINIGHWIAPELVYDALSNAQAAFVASRGGSNWSAWGLGDQGWAGHLLQSIPAVHANLFAKYQYWYDRFPLA